MKPQPFGAMTAWICGGCKRGILTVVDVVIGIGDFKCDSYRWLGGECGGGVIEEAPKGCLNIIPNHHYL
ncbi:hypothetical protein Tco_0750861 [Tanacetum coccineum]|uniref:Uncharacterized protein n=1 Tax=Tanacetum coccineum TaxID=301880 RepID=A0ABQ4Z3C9_9ASTR